MIRKHITQIYISCNYFATIRSTINDFYAEFGSSLELVEQYVFGTNTSFIFNVIDWGNERGCLVESDLIDFNKYTWILLRTNTIRSYIYKHNITPTILVEKEEDIETTPKNFKDGVYWEKICEKSTTHHT